MARNAGDPSAVPAVRSAPTGWRDPRLWIGVVVVLGSVVAGARLFATADDTEPVWAVSLDMGAGDEVTADDLVARRVQFSDAADADLYFAADESLPADLTLLRGVGAGELLPRAAVGPAGEAGTLQVPVEVDPNRVPPSVVAGSVVDVYVAAPERGGGGGGGGEEGPALEGVTVLDAPPSEESLAITGTRLLVLAVPEDDVVAFEALIARLDDPAVRVLQRS